MNRRTALMGVFAIMSEMLRGDVSANQGFAFWPPPESLTVRLGGPEGYQRFTVTHGTESVTFTAEELFEALKADPPR